MIERYCPDCNQIREVSFQKENKVACRVCGYVYKTQKTRRCCECKGLYITAEHDNYSTHCEDCNKTIYCMSCNADRNFAIRDKNVYCLHCGHVANIKPETLKGKRVSEPKDFEAMRKLLNEYDDLMAQIYKLKTFVESTEDYPNIQTALKQEISTLEEKINAL